MQKSGEKLCLQWNEFNENTSSAFRDLRDDKEFTDVTLACKDGQQVEAHKVVLIASSPFFLNLLKKNKHLHPLVFMKGVKYGDLIAMLDFLYNGEANVFQENLDSFLTVAEELRLKGLQRHEEVEVGEVSPEKMKKSNRLKKTNVEQSASNCKTLTQETCDKSSEISVSETGIALNGSFDYVELDRQVAALMTQSENMMTQGRGKIYLHACKECGKEGQRVNIMNHIESNHMSGVCIPCNHCGKTLNTRQALYMHVRRNHKQSASDDQENIKK